MNITNEFIAIISYRSKRSKQILNLKTLSIQNSWSRLNMFKCKVFFNVRKYTYSLCSGCREGADPRDVWTWPSCYSTPRTSSLGGVVLGGRQCDHTPGSGQFCLPLSIRKAVGTSPVDAVLCSHCPSPSHAGSICREQSGGGEPNPSWAKSLLLERVGQRGVPYLELNFWLVLNDHTFTSTISSKQDMLSLLSVTAQILKFKG